MKFIYSILASLALTDAWLTDYSREIEGGLEHCVWNEGSAGWYIGCPDMQVARGVCSSGKNPDCHQADRYGAKTYVKVKCCNTKHDVYPDYGIVARSNELHSRSYGEWNICSQDKIMIGVCGSASGRDCNNINRGPNYTEAQCAKYSAFKIWYNDCVHLRGGYGVEVECPKKMVLIAWCGSGRNGDCDGSYTQIKCCNVQAMHEPR
jgi:hypothetical protein